MEKIKKLTEQLTTAMKDYQKSPDYDSIQLEIAIDDLLCKLPKDVVYLEWYDRSQIADFITDDKKNTIDACMYALWDSNDSVMDSYAIQEIINNELGE